MQTAGDRRLSPSAGAGGAGTEARELPEHIVTIIRQWYTHDQDALNMAVMASDARVSVLSPDGMGFTGMWNFPIGHAIGRLKPWNKPLRLLLRHGPSKVDRIWWRYASGAPSGPSAG